MWCAWPSWRRTRGHPGRVVNSVIVDRYLGIMVLLAMGLVAALLRPGHVACADRGCHGCIVFRRAAGGVAAAPALVGERWQSAAIVSGRAVRLLRLPMPWPTRSRPTTARAIRPWTRGIPDLQPAADRLERGHRLGVGLRLPLTVYLVFVPLTAVALLLPAFGGLGVRELTYVGLVRRGRRAAGHRAGALVGRVYHHRRHRAGRRGDVSGKRFAQDSASRVVG